MSVLDPVMEWYEVADDNQRLMRMFLLKHPDLFPLDSVLSSKTSEEARNTLDKAKTELDDLTIVSLFSIFESKLLNHIASIINTISSEPPNAFIKSVAEYAVKNSERWSVNDILDLYKSKINPELIGNIKQIYKYRNWVAHGKKAARPVVLDPNTAYQRLDDFLEQADLINN
jgi:hypothetical protein